MWEAEVFLQNASSITYVVLAVNSQISLSESFVVCVSLFAAVWSTDQCVLIGARAKWRAIMALGEQPTGSVQYARGEGHTPATNRSITTGRCGNSQSFSFIWCRYCSDLLIGGMTWLGYSGYYIIYYCLLFCLEPLPINWLIEEVIRLVGWEDYEFFRFSFDLQNIMRTTIHASKK